MATKTRKGRDTGAETVAVENSPSLPPPAPQAPPTVRRLFGTDGIRGLANEHPMTPEIAMKVGAAVTWWASRGGRPARVVVGKDTRLSGYLFETALAAGICAQGGRVMLTGPLPTPAIAHIVQSMRADAGVVISASHNPYMDNGIKLFGADGFKLPDQAEAEIEALMDDPRLLHARKRDGAIGRAEKIEDSRGRYVTFVKSTFPKSLRLDGLRVVVDGAHGAAFRVAPAVFSELGASVIAIGVKPNGKNINDGVGALHPEHMARVVREKNAHLGIALDGDADRLIVVDEQGQVVDGDAIMAMVAKRLSADHLLAKNTVVATVMSNLGLERALASHGAKLIRTSVGDRYVVEAMRRGGYNFGGEQSGHLLFLDHATTGDGLIAALQVVSILVRESRSLSEIAALTMVRVPQVLVNVKLPARRDLASMSLTQRAIRDAEKKLASDGRVLVRWSGTEPKLRVMVEGPKADTIERMANAIADAAKQDLKPAT
ncbi:MAG: phosphoglucosamine mutase [Deltaproteobacteria bacterium]|nr:phosphoglucosamine mutase [Deltaproteobacteria bacterium]